MTNLLLQPQYRATVYAPRSVDATEATVMTPPAGAPHSDAFKVATMSGLSGFQPYLDIPMGRSGSLDVRERKTDTGQMTLKLLDHRTTVGGTNLERWVTAFSGDASGSAVFIGRKVYVEESLDNGSSWDAFFTGRITSAKISGRVWVELQVQDLFVDLDDRLFTGTPYPSATAAQGPNIVPVGLAADWGPFPAATPLTAVLAVAGGGGALVTINQGQAFQSALTTATLPMMPDRPGFNLVRDLLADLTWSGGSGTFRVVAAVHNNPLKLSDGSTGLSVSVVNVHELDASEPGYSLLPSNGAVTIRIYPAKWALSEAMPLLINDVHPVTLIRWIVDGYFGERALDGSPLRAVARYTGTGTPGTAGDPWYDLEQDLSFGTCRFLISEVPEKRRTWITDAIGKSFALAIALDETGKVRIIDVRARAAVSPVATLTNDDLAGGTAPSWSHVRDGAVSRIECTYHLDAQVPINVGQLDSPTLLTSTDVVAVELNVSERALDAEGKPLEIDCLGFRAGTSEVSPIGGATVDATDRDRYLRRQIGHVFWDYRWLFGAGPMVVSIPCRRTTNARAIRPGSFFLAEIDELVDPATSRRGGERLYLCTSRDERGPVLTLGAIDCGKNVAATTPSVSLAASTADPVHSVDVTVTASVDLDPVAIDYILTATSVGTRPADTAAGWTRATVVEYEDTLPHGTTIDGLSSGRRVWIRVSALPVGYTGPALTSSYVYPTTTHVDLSTIAGPTSGAVSLILKSTAHLAWTNTNTDDPVDVFLIQSASAPADWLETYRVATLPAGSTQFNLSGLSSAAGSSYTWRARCRDASGGVSAGTGTTFTNGSTTFAAPTPPAPVVMSTVGPSTWSPKDVTLGPVHPGSMRRVGVELLVMPADAAYDRELQRTTDSAGAPNVGAAVTIATIKGTQELYFDALPLTGAVYWYRQRQVGLSADPSDYSGWVSGTALPIIASLQKAEATRQLSTFYANDGTLQSSVAVRRDTGGPTTTFLTKGLRKGTCRHGDAVTFSPAFAGTPVVHFGQMRADQSAAVWSATTAVPGALARLATAGADPTPLKVPNGLTPSGFTAQLLLIQKGSPTAHNQDFSGVAITAAGGTDLSAALGASAPATSDQYVIRITGSIFSKTNIAGLFCRNDVVVAVERDTTGGGSYAEVWRTPSPYTAADIGGTTGTTYTINETVTVGVAGMTTTGKFRIKVISATKTGTGTTTQSVRGKVNGTDGAPGVTFYTATNQYASGTPNADDFVEWFASEGS